jgi:AraC-like DNA-binding protein
VLRFGTVKPRLVLDHLKIGRGRQPGGGMGFMTVTKTGPRARPAKTVAAASGLPGAALRRVLEYIDANRHRRPRLSELSTLAHLSAFHFARLFKKSTGLSPHHFVVGRRIDRAKELLVTESASIATVAGAVGFRTASHFTSVFRRTTGVTPGAYRSAARESLPEATAPPATSPGFDT